MGYFHSLMNGMYLSFLTHKRSRVPKGTCSPFMYRCIHKVVAPLPVVRFLFCFFCLTDNILGYVHSFSHVILPRQLGVTAVSC
jgi:hypothetical protein